MSDKKPAIPSDFPLVLVELIRSGWSKVPKERPSIEEFKSAFMEMLTEEEKDEYNKVTHMNTLKTTLSEMREEKIEMLKPENSEEIKNPTDQEKKSQVKNFGLCMP